jgi:FG-GAP-like repeat
LLRTSITLAILLWLAGFICYLLWFDINFTGILTSGMSLAMVILLVNLWLPAGVSRWLRWPIRVLAVAVLGIVLFLAFLYGQDFLKGVYSPYKTITSAHMDYPELGTEWVMHKIDNPLDLLPNGLDDADVNADGYTDFVTNYEALGRVRIAFHPGLDVRTVDAWPAIDVGTVINAESSALADLDGDGRTDVVVVHGIEGAIEPPGVRVYWNTASPGAAPQDMHWTPGNDIPASHGDWQITYTKVADLDGDGDGDIITGGRGTRWAFGDKDKIEEEVTAWAGIRWFENPGHSQARDLQQWTLHDIDANSRSGHGFYLGDMDNDGDLDIANANSDFDTPEAEENVVWYENPGPALVREPWSSSEVLRSNEFYAKEQVSIDDLEHNGLMDIVVHTPERIYIVHDISPDNKTGRSTTTVGKHVATQWRARPLRTADLNNDGRTDIVGALIHHNGSLPQSKAAVFWMEQTDAGWRTHVIKWGDGYAGINFVNGEKWDQMIPMDVDSDGDTDIVANVEEYSRISSVLAVVWFENPLVP